MSEERHEQTNNRPTPRTLMRWATRRFRNVVPRRITGHLTNGDPASILEAYQKNDCTENVETAPPEDEHVELRCMWAVEFYTPSHVDKLINSFQCLEWDQDDLPGRESPASWVRTTRRLFDGGSWLNLGIIRSDSDIRPRPTRDRTAPLPLHVRYARGGLYSLTPSLTCIVMCLVFEDEFRGRLNDVLKTPRQTFTRPVPGGHEIYGPERQKTEDIRELRHKCASLAMKWFRQNLPGVFSSGLHGDQLPTCELITLHESEPFPDLELGEPPPAFLSVLDLRFFPSVWRSTKMHGLKFSSGLSGHNPQYHSAFVVRYAALGDDQLLQPYGGSTGLTTYVDHTYQEMIAKLAIWPLLDGYGIRLNELRDSVTTEIRNSSRRRPFRSLQAPRQQCCLRR